MENVCLLPPKTCADKNMERVFPCDVNHNTISVAFQVNHCSELNHIQLHYEIRSPQVGLQKLIGICPH